MHANNMKGSHGDNMNFKVLNQLFLALIHQYEFLNIVMYEDLLKRREFVHDCWVLAQLSMSFELMQAISADQYFYLTRDDLLELLINDRSEVINHLLRSNVKTKLIEDEGYYLVQIKETQVNMSQLTPLMLLDFISVMLQFKRFDNFDMESKMQFDNGQILKFMKTHSAFLVPEQVIRICILYKRFRLTIAVINNFNINFEISFFK